MWCGYLIEGGPIYCSCWSPDSDHVLYASGKTLNIKPLQSGLKPVQWNAHEKLILCVDWSSAHNFIISGGEDRKYKVKPSEVPGGLGVGGGRCLYNGSDSGV